jgi:8-oxo-dGTP pyrophosphatase MutT (NUDIX family)
MKKCISATCMLIDDGKVLFLNHIKLGNWMPPGGHVDQNETPIDAVHREVREETGYSINIIDTYSGSAKTGYISDEIAEEMVRPMVILLEHVNYREGQHDHFDLVYLATVDKAKAREPAESSKDMRWFGKDEIDKLNTFENCKKVAYKAFEAYESFRNEGK